jgi:ADP-ribose pyrophosphatase YjhB (NUDIX family)
MEGTETPRWLAWAREIQAIGQTGRTYSENDYHAQRYHRLSEIAAEIVAAHTAIPREWLSRHFLAQQGYATPKVDVRGAVLRDGGILLVQEKVDECWCMPGGWADVGESPAVAVAREVREESGFDVEPRKLIAVFDANRTKRPREFFHAYKLLFLCELTGGEARPSSETLAAGFFDFDALPPLSAERTAPRHLAEVRAHLSDPARETAFE